MKFLLSILFSFLFITAKSQNFESDLLLVKHKQLFNNEEANYYKRDGNNQQVMQNHNHHIISKYNPVTIALKASMLLYQNIISPQLSRTCAYQITCSNFSKQAIQQFGIIKGVFLSADRIMRCNRISLLDVNPLNIDEATGTVIDPLSNY